LFAKRPTNYTWQEVWHCRTREIISIQIAGSLTYIEHPEGLESINFVSILANIFNDMIFSESQKETKRLQNPEKTTNKIDCFSKLQFGLNIITNNHLETIRDPSN
jgi:hypothetical protein